MKKEQLYQTNIYNFLKAVEESIDNAEKEADENKTNLKQIKLFGFAEGLNAGYCAIKDLQQKTFNGKEFTKEEIMSVLNES